MEERCDQIIHCNDKSDEKNCKLVVFEESYNKKIPPFTTDKTKIIPVKVNVSIFLKNVLKIEESLHTIDMKVGISLGWKEATRVQYHNLKQEEALNILDNDEVNVWMDLIFYKEKKHILGQQIMDPLHHIWKHGWWWSSDIGWKY